MMSKCPSEAASSGTLVPCFKTRRENPGRSIFLFHSLEKYCNMSRGSFIYISVQQPINPVTARISCCECVDETI